MRLIGRLPFVQCAHYVLHVWSADAAASLPALQLIGQAAVVQGQVANRTSSLRRCQHSASGVFRGVLHKRSEARWLSTVAFGVNVLWSQAAITVTA